MSLERMADVFAVGTMRRDGRVRTAEWQQQNSAKRTATNAADDTATKAEG